MNMLHLVLGSLRQHLGSSLLAAASIAVGVALLLAVTSLREQAHTQFTQVGLGVDAVLGPKGSPLQITLNALYHLEEMPGTVPWSSYQEIRKHPVVADGFVFVTGHSYAGFRVNAVEQRFLNEFEYLPGRRFSTATADGGSGRMFTDEHEAVAGADVARALGLQLGHSFSPVCGVKEEGGHHHDEHVKFVGILAPTGTPHDRAIYMPLEDFYTLGGHGEAVADMAKHTEHRVISGAYLKLARIRGNAFHPGVQQLQYEINQSTTTQFILPAEVMPRLFAIIGWVDRVLLAVGGLVAALAAAFLGFALLATLRERRRDLALLRALGARRQTIFTLVLSQALVISLAGAVAGWVGGHALTWVGCHYVHAETGMRFSPWFYSSADFWLLPTTILLGLLAGLIPAIQAYRLGLLTTLKPQS
ncbi:MAG: ABC transporter permease [Planctomycetota bacterium]